MTLFVILMLIALVWVNYIANHIPKTGRDGNAKGEEITAVITNRNKVADKAVTLRATADGRNFKVKMKPTEAHLWIKGDSIRIILSADRKTYRVLFNDYFRENEARLREYALEILEKKVNTNFIAAHIVKYTKENLESFKVSKLESQRIFTFASLMSIIDVYTAVTALLGAAFLIWYIKTSPAFGEMIVPLALIVLLVWVLYSSAEICKRIMKEAQKD